MNVQADTLRARVSRHRQGARLPRTLAVGSGRRGVGKTTIVANLAIALQRRGLRVVLVDFDLGAGGLGALLGLQPSHTLLDVVRGDCTVREIAVESHDGLLLVPAAPALDALANLSPWQQERLARDLGELDEAADLVLLDAPAGTAPAAMSVLAAAPEALIVASPQPAAVADSYALIKTLVRRRPDAVVRLLVNRVRLRQEALSVAERIARVAERFLGVSVADAGFVLDDLEAAEAARSHAAFVEACPNGGAARCIAAVATRLRAPAGAVPHGSLADCVRRLATLQAHALGSEDA